MEQIAAAYGQRGPVVVGVKRQKFEVLELLIQEYVHMIIKIVDQSERTHRTGLQAQVVEQALFGGKTQLALTQFKFQVADGQVLFAMKHHQVMPVAFVVPEKQIFTMNARQMFPILPADFDAGGGRMLQVMKVDVQLFESGVNLLLSNHRINNDLGAKILFAQNQYNDTKLGFLLSLSTVLSSRNMSDDKKIIFSMVGVNKIFPPHKQVLKDIYLSFYYGAKIGIIGLNGSGKSTLMKIIAGIEKDYQGNVVFSPGYSVGYLEQEPKLDKAKTVKEIVMEGVQEVTDVLKEYEEINQLFALPEYYEDADKMQKLFDRQAELQNKIDATDAWNIDNKLERAMDALRCPPDDQTVETLSGGERRRVALCRLLLQQPDVLLLDEPTNHLDAESIDWLEQHLQQYPGTVIAVTHDRYFLDHVAGWILELDRGEGIPWKGNYSSWLEQKTQRMAMEEKQASKRRRTLERELEWVRMAPKARHAKGKARLNSYDKLLNEDQKQREDRLELFIPNGPRLGNKVIEALDVAKAYGHKCRFEQLNFSLPPNGIVGVIGPNGAGKTTLFKLIMGLEQADKGSFEVGETVRIGYVDQSHEAIKAEQTVYQIVSGGQEFIRVGGKEINARAYLSRFNFTGADQEKKAGVLSGGERNRLHLALNLKSESNVLLLDEPTNDIDVNTLRALVEGRENFAGCAVVNSHDRWFLDRICAHILSFEGNLQVYDLVGSYTEYEENKRLRLGDENPRRIRYRQWED